MNSFLNYFRRFSKSWKRVDAVFSKAYHRNIWGSKESISGTGSEKIQTLVLIEKLPEILGELKVERMLDLPCGDFNWMRHVNLDGIHYMGADIVTPIIEKNKTEFAGAGREFLRLNLITDDLPQADLIFCRDCLVHLSIKDIALALKNICRSGARFLATTTFTEHNENIDIPTGCWRPINLEKEPFSLPPPFLILNENCTEAEGIYSDKSLAVWKISDLKKW